MLDQERRYGDYNPATYETPQCRAGNHDACTGDYSTGCRCRHHTASRTGPVRRGVTAMLRWLRRPTC